MREAITKDAAVGRTIEKIEECGDSVVFLLSGNAFVSIVAHGWHGDASAYIAEVGDAQHDVWYTAPSVGLATSEEYQAHHAEERAKREAEMERQSRVQYLLLKQKYEGGAQ